MLSINIWELLWTVVNFFLLYFLLKKLLYEPVLGFMEQRQARIDAGANEELRIQETIIADKTLMDEEKEKCRLEAKRLIDGARAEYEQKQALSGKKARESSLTRSQLRERVEDLRRQEESLFLENEEELAGILVCRLLSPEQGSAG